MGGTRPKPNRPPPKKRRPWPNAAAATPMSSTSAAIARRRLIGRSIAPRRVLISVELPATALGGRARCSVIPGGDEDEIRYATSHARVGGAGRGGRVARNRRVGPAGAARARRRHGGHDERPA